MNFNDIFYTFIQFLEIDEGFWDHQAPSLVLPGDTMPPLCTRNTLFSPDVFWALPLLPDYSTGRHTKSILFSLILEL